MISRWGGESSVGKNVTIALIGCVTETVTGGSKNVGNLNDVIYGWSLVELDVVGGRGVLEDEAADARLDEAEVLRVLVAALGESLP